jgi:dihydroorotase
MFIDPHVHCRDGKEAYKETIEHALNVAEKVGVDAIFDMPNTSPPIISKNQAVSRLQIASLFYSNVFYGLYIGLTSDPNQISEAVGTAENYFPIKGSIAGIVGLKYFAGKSVGDLSITDLIQQRKLWEELVKNRYSGVVAVHCEDENLFLKKLWNPKEPISHSYSRPPNSEFNSAVNQIDFALEAGFQGTLHIAHVSTPETVDYITSIKDNWRGIKITCGAAPQHIFMNQNDYGYGGLFFKVNPPLRTQEQQQGVLKKLKEKKIDWIETDHAPHSRAEKTGMAKDRNGEPIYLSGIPGLDLWPKISLKLKQNGFSDTEIDDITFSNAIKVFGLENVIKKTERVSEDVQDYNSIRPHLKWT